MLITCHKVARPPIFLFLKELSERYAAAKSLQSCPTLCDPIDGSPPGSLSLGFSRQEHWSGLPFPSPMHESEKWKWSCSVVSDPQRPHGLQPSKLLHPWDFPGKSTRVGCHCLLHHLRLEAIYWRNIFMQFSFIHCVFTKTQSKFVHFDFVFTSWLSISVLLIFKHVRTFYAQFYWHPT